MDHIKFKSLFARNFRSINNTGMTITYEGGLNTLVVSTDNGSGKSTMWRDALFYALFDKPYAKGQTKSQLINSASGNQLLVKLEFERGGVEYVVERGQQPSIFSISVDGTPLNKEAVNFQEVLLKILGADEKVFTNSVILGADKFVPFTSMPAEDRRRYCDQMLDLVVITTMSDINKQNVKDNTTAISNCNTGLAAVKIKIDGVKEVIEVKRKNAEERRDQLQSALTDHVQKVVRLEGQIEELLPALDVEKSTLTDLQSKLKNEVDTFDSSIQDEKTKLVQALEEIRADAYPHSYEVPSIKVHIQELGAKHKKLMGEVEGEITALNKDKSTLSELDKMKAEFQSRIDNLKAPNRDMPCVHCGGIVGDDFFQKHLDNHQAELDKYQKGLSAVESRLSTYAERDLDKEHDVLALRMVEIQQQYDNDLTQLQSDLETAQAKEQAWRVEWATRSSEAQSAVNNFENDCKSKRLEIISKYQDEINNAKSNISKAESQIQHLESNLQAEQDRAERTQQELDSLDLSGTKADEDRLVALQQEEIVIDEELKTHHYKQKILELMTKNLKDGGIKAKIVENYLPYINQRINFYLEKLNFFVNVELTSNFELKMMGSGRGNQTIPCLSAGQQKRIDIAVLMAWRDVSRQAAVNSCNILIMDEILESLSQNGIIDFIEMWNASDEAKYTHLVVISQRKSELEVLFDDVKEYKLVDKSTVEVV